MKNLLICFLLITISVNQNLYGQEKAKTDTFSFSFEGKRRVGLVDQPVGRQPSAMIILVPGSGKTNIFGGSGYADLRRHFVQQGIACVIWDKAGCGKSDGVFDPDQPVQNSAGEVIAAIEELKHENVPGTNKIGLWGISRAGWICPLVIAQYPSIAFWISVSGTDDKENFGYLLERNFLIEGRSISETKKLMDEWKKDNELTAHGGSFEEDLKATENLRRDPFYMFLSNNSVPTKEGYLAWQKKFETGENRVDKKSGLLIYVPDFEKTLNKIHCPVLAIFGEKDSQVDWRKTIGLYSKTLGKNSKTQLTIKTFPNGNHNLIACKTGGYREQLAVRQPCEGYIETMVEWLQDKGFTAIER